MLNFPPSPVPAVDDLEDLKFPDETHKLFRWGGYLKLCVCAECRVFIDGKVDLCAEAFSETYLKAQTDGLASLPIRRPGPPQQ